MVGKQTSQHKYSGFVPILRGAAAKECVPATKMCLARSCPFIKGAVRAHTKGKTAFRENTPDSVTAELFRKLYKIGRGMSQRDKAEKIRTQN